MADIIDNIIQVSDNLDYENGPDSENVYVSKDHLSATIAEITKHYDEYEYDAVDYDDHTLHEWRREWTEEEDGRSIVISDYNDSDDKFVVEISIC